MTWCLPGLALLVVGAVLLVPWAFGGRDGGPAWRAAGFGMLLLVIGLGWLVTVGLAGAQ